MQMGWIKQSLATLLLLYGIGTAMAEPRTILTAQEAFDMAQAGEVLLVDVRSPQEWRRTGIPKGAVAETIHRAGGMRAFSMALFARIERDPNQPVALICATGGRSSYIQAALTKAGFTAIADVSEGMEGNGARPGWRKSGLPIDAWPQSE